GRSEKVALVFLLLLSQRPVGRPLLHAILFWMISNKASLVRGVLIFFVAAVLSAPSSAQRSQPKKSDDQYSPKLLAEMRQLLNAALTSDYAYRQLAHICNNIGPRLSGSPQANHAAQYVAAELRKLGLDTKLEKVMVPHWVRGVE